MIKRDMFKEIQNGLKDVKECIDEGVLNNDFSEAFLLINKKMKELVGVDINTINTVSFDTVKSMINSGFENNSDKYIALGMLLKYEGDIYGRKNDVSNQIFFYILSISSFNEAFDSDDTYLEEYKNDINKILKEVNKYELSDEEQKEVSNMVDLLK